MFKKRKIYLINKSFQLSILGWFAFLSLILIGIFYFSIWYFFKEFANEAIEAGLPPGHVFFKFLDSQRTYMNYVFLLSSVVSCIVILFGGLFLSNKVAGPLYRMTQHLKTNSKKNVVNLKFRKGDYFLELQDAFNEFMKRE